MEHAVQRNTKTTGAKKQNSFFGNKNEQPFFTAPFIQPKLEVGPVDDLYEREADAMADKVMQMPDTDIMQTKISPVNIQRTCAHCEEEKNIQKKSVANIVQRQPGDHVPTHVSTSDDAEKQYGDRSFFQLHVTVPAQDVNDPDDRKINYGEANLQLIQNGVISPGDFTVDYEDLWKTDYKLTTEWGLGNIVKNLYGYQEKIDRGLLGPVRSGVKRIPLIGGFLSSKIKLKNPTDLKNNDWDTWITNKMALSGLGAATSRDYPAYNQDSGLTFTINIIDTHFDENKIHRKPASPSGNINTFSAEQSLQSGGQPIDNATRSFMESRFGYDFANVQIHNNAQANQSARDINALAYTHGRDIVFGAGQYKPESDSGKQLLAHELTHVVQQNSKNGLIQKKGCGPSSSAEGTFAAINPGKVFLSVDSDPKSVPNEMTLWNFCVGGTDLRDEHTAALQAQVSRWNTMMNPQNGTRNDLRINITGTASSSGNAAQNVQLAKDRADKVRDFLVTNGIPSNIITSSGTGSSTPLANGGTPEDEARNRRVELFLFTPTQTMNIPGSLVAANVSNLAIVNGKSAPTHFFDPVQNQFSRRVFAMRASADVDFTGFKGDIIGMLQFLTADTRNAHYADSQGNLLTLDFDHCTSPLPCRDVEDATSLFSFDKETLVLKNTGSEAGNVTMHDAPGTAFPMKYKGKSGAIFTLQKYTWNMEFDLILGIRSGNGFMPLNAVRWSLSSVEDVDVKNKKVSGAGPSVTLGKWATTTAAAKSNEIDFGMNGKTCRYLLRSLETGKPENPCRPNET